MQENSIEVPSVGKQTQAELHDKSSLTEALPTVVNSSESSERHSPKPSGRARRLQPPFFKERIERVLSKLKVREVKNELDTIGNDTQEEEIYTLPDIIDLGINLEKELIDELKAPVNKNFSTEIGENSTQQQEIRLQREDGELRSLNALLPKGYKFQEADKFVMNRKKRAISYMPEVINSKGGVLAVLHEIGHARNYESGKIEKSPFYTLSPTEKLIAGAIHAMDFVMDLPVKLKSPQWLKDKEQSWLARNERAAWAYAFQEGRALEKQGFHIFAGFKNAEAIRDFANTALMSYEAGKIVRDLLSSTKPQSEIFASKFVKQHVLDKKLEETPPIWCDLASLN